MFGLTSNIIFLSSLCIRLNTPSRAACMSTGLLHSRPAGDCAGAMQTHLKDRRWWAQNISHVTFVGVILKKVNVGTVQETKLAFSWYSKLKLRGWYILPAVAQRGKCHVTYPVLSGVMDIIASLSNALAPDVSALYLASTARLRPRGKQTCQPPLPRTPAPGPAPGTGPPPLLLQTTTLPTASTSATATATTTPTTPC